MVIGNYFPNKGKEKILIFGTGSAALKFIECIRRTYKIVGFMDNDEQKHGTKLNGIDVFPPNDITKFPGVTVIIASDFFDEIYANLKGNKYFVHTNIVYFRALDIQIPKAKNISVWFKNKIKDLICKMPSIFVPTLRKMLNARALNLANIISLDDDNLHRQIVLREAQSAKAIGPNFINGCQEILDVTIPAVCLYQYFNCQISTLSRAFKTADNNVVIEKLHTVNDQIGKYSQGHLTQHHQNKLAVVREERSNALSKGILINGFYDRNYYHWIIDVIPQLQYIDELPEKYDDMPILMSEMANRILSVKELVSLLKIDREIIYLPSTQDFVVENLLVISSPNRCCPRIMGSARSRADYTYSRRESIHFLRNLVLDKSTNSEQSFAKKVFLAPSMKHRKYNQDDVFDRLQKYGFVKINPEQMGLVEQASIFSNADIIVGPTGATWTNLVFAKDGARALCWMAEEWGDFSSFSNLADIVNVDLKYLTYKAGVVNHVDLFSKGYEIDADAIEKWVETNTNS